MHQNQFWLGLCPDPTGELISPDHLVEIKGTYFWGKGRGARKGGERRKGREGGKRMKRRGKGRLAIPMLVCFQCRWKLDTMLSYWVNCESCKIKIRNWISNKHPMGCEAQLAWKFYSRPLFPTGYFDPKVGQTDLVFYEWLGFISGSVQARLQVSGCSSYDLFHPG